MAEERIDIEVVDKVDRTIPTKLEQIAAAAERGHSHVERLKAALAAVNATPVTRLAEASARVTNALTKETLAQAKLIQMQDRAAATAAKVALEQQRLATETARTATAQANAATAAARKEAAELKAAAATQKAAEAMRQQNAEANRSIAILSSRARSQEEVNAAEARFAQTQRQWSSGSSNWRQEWASQNSRFAETQADVARETQRASAAAAELDARMSKLRGSVDPLNVSLDRHIAEFREAQMLYRQGAISAETLGQYETTLKSRIDATTAAINNQNAARTRGIQSSKAMTQATLNLSRQFADIGVTAAMGMNPLMILIQQGPQVADAFQMAGTQGLAANQVMKQMATMAGRLVLALAPLILIGGAIAGGFALMHRELSKKYPDDITKGLNLTEEQLKRVTSKTVTMGDTFHATIQIMGEDIMNGPIGPAIKQLEKWWTQAMDWIWETGSQVTAAQNGMWMGSIKFILDNWRRFPAAMGDLFVQATNASIIAMEQLVNAGVAGINAFIAGVNKIPGVDLPQLNTASLPRMRNQFQGAGRDLAIDYVKTTVSEIGNQYQQAETRLGRIGAAALARARKRALKEAGDPNKAPSGRRGGAQEWDRAGELEKVNRGLDNEISRMKMLSDAREVQNRLDTISQKFAEKGKALTDTETKAIRDKIQAIQDYSFVQKEMDRLYEDSIAPMRTHAATLQALTTLYDQGKLSAERLAYEQAKAGRALADTKDITGAGEALRTYEDLLDKAKLALSEGTIAQAEFDRQVRQATFAYNLAKDPLAQYTQELDQQLATLGLYGPALERANYLQQIQNTLQAQGRTLYDASTGALTTEAAALMAKYDQLQRGLFIQQQVNALYQDVTANDMFLANLTAMYAEIDRMRQADVVSTEQAERMKRQLHVKYEEMRLANTRTFFGDLASLSSSGNSKLAAIGKAAAVAQATIDGYVAVQKALASAPPPFNYAMAAATAVKSAVQIAGIMSTNVGSFATGGQFMVQGKSGVDANNINMNVTRGERVTIETPAQQRAADGGQGGSNVEVPLTVINVYDQNEALAMLDGPDGERVVLNILSRNSNTVNGILQGNNS